MVDGLGLIAVELPDLLHCSGRYGRAMFGDHWKVEPGSIKIPGWMDIFSVRLFGFFKTPLLATMRKCLRPSLAPWLFSS